MLGYFISGVLVVVMITTLALLAERAAQAAAWRRIADERRWNRENRDGNRETRDGGKSTKV